ncbi:unnamed protein product [Dovyalis caffra]|uniref:Uncharacterized protein n=1 Tax=Dovyalis caffra TaxID=77055 RepID=A0AAV1SRM7_9ROSI|nr:unnamed protein product [Dovyalis caffra]
MVAEISEKRAAVPLDWMISRLMERGPALDGGGTSKVVGKEMLAVELKDGVVVRLCDFHQLHQPIQDVLAGLALAKRLMRDLAYPFSSAHSTSMPVLRAIKPLLQANLFVLGQEYLRRFLSLRLAQLALFIALSVSGGEAARHLLQFPPLPSIPNLPKPTSPPLPSLPTLPQPTLPTTQPSFPNPTLPPLPSLPTMPTLPKVTLPPLPSMPSIPTIPTTIPSIPFLSPPPGN